MHLFFVHERRPMALHQTLKIFNFAGDNFSQPKNIVDFGSIEIVIFEPNLHFTSTKICKERNITIQSYKHNYH